MASVFVYHVVGDLTVAKPELVEFLETETVEAAIKAIGESTESGIPVWKRKKGNVVENSEMRQQRFVGILNPLDIVAFLGRMEDQEKALMTPVSEIVVPDKSLLKEVDPATSSQPPAFILPHGNHVANTVCFLVNEQRWLFDFTFKHDLPEPRTRVHIKQGQIFDLLVGCAAMPDDGSLIDRSKERICCANDVYWST